MAPKFDQGEACTKEIEFRIDKDIVLRFLNTTTISSGYAVVIYKEGK